MAKADGVDMEVGENPNPQEVIDNTNNSNENVKPAEPSRDGDEITSENNLTNKDTNTEDPEIVMETHEFLINQKKQQQEAKAEAHQQRAEAPKLKWKNPRLVMASISSIEKFEEEKLARDLEKRGLWHKVIGFAVSGNRRVMEIEFISTKDAEHLIDEPLSTHGRTLSFRPVTSSTVTVSLLGVPLGFPLTDTKDIMAFYGEIAEAYNIKKEIYGKRLNTGKIILKFKTLNSPIPRQVSIGDRPVRAIYTGQEEQLLALQKQQADERGSSDEVTPNVVPPTEKTQEVIADGEKEKEKTEIPTPPAIEPDTKTTEDPADEKALAEKAIRENTAAAWANAVKAAGNEASPPAMSKAAMVPNPKKRPPKPPSHSDNEVVSKTHKHDYSKEQPPQPVLPADVKRAVHSSLHPEKASLDEVFTFTDNNYDDYDGLFNLSKYLTDLIDDEVNQFTAIFLYRKYKHYTDKRNSRDSVLPENVVDYWKYVSEMTADQRKKITRKFLKRIQEVWSS